MSSRKFPKFSKSEYSRRNKELKRLLEEESADAAIIFGSPGNVANLYYWTHYITKSSSYFVTDSNLSEGLLFIGTYNHIPTAKEMSVVDKIEWATHSTVEAIVTSVKKILGTEKTKSKKVALIGNVFPHDLVEGLESQLSVETANLTKKANQIRAIKSKEEISWLLKGVELTDRAMMAIENELRVGMTEHEITDIVEHSYLPLGGATRIHYMGSTSMMKPEIYVPPQYQTSRRLRKGDVVITEISAEYEGYAGQLHRPIAIGTKPTSNYLKLYDIALRSYESLLSKLKDRATSEELIQAADEVIVKEGYTVCDSLVHGYGTDLAFPELGTSNSVYANPHYEFKENMAIVIQPNPVTYDNKFGLQLGNLCLVGKTKSVSLQKFPMKFIVIRR